MTKLNSSNQGNLQAACTHEAGHAVCSHVLGLGNGKIVLTERPDLPLGVGGGAVVPAQENADKLVRLHLLAVSIAGVLAEEECRSPGFLGQRLLDCDSPGQTLTGLISDLAVARSDSSFQNVKGTLREWPTPNSDWGLMIDHVAYLQRYDESISTPHEALAAGVELAATTLQGNWSEVERIAGLLSDLAVAQTDSGWTVELDEQVAFPSLE